MKSIRALFTELSAPAGLQNSMVKRSHLLFLIQVTAFLLYMKLLTSAGVSPYHTVL